MYRAFFCWVLPLGLGAERKPLTFLKPFEMKARTKLKVNVISSSRGPIVSLVQEIRLNLRLMMNRWTLWAKWSRCRTYVKLCAKRYQRYARINFSFMIDTLQTVRNSISIRNELKYLRESFKKTECETWRDSRWLAYSRCQCQAAEKVILKNVSPLLWKLLKSVRIFLFCSFSFSIDRIFDDLIRQYLIYMKHNQKNMMKRILLPTKRFDMERVLFFWCRFWIIGLSEYQGKNTRKGGRSLFKGTSRRDQSFNSDLFLMDASWYAKTKKASSTNQQSWKIYKVILLTLDVMSTKNIKSMQTQRGSTMEQRTK